MTYLQAHNRAFKAELLKLKHSGMLWLCLGAALFIPLLNTIVSFFIDMYESAPEANRWALFIERNFTGFTSFFFPLFLVLMTTRLVYLEHRSDTWKLLETQPVAKAALFGAKWEVAALISLFCLLGLFVFTLLGGALLQVAKPGYHFARSSIDWGSTFAAILRFWIASFAIISIQYLFGLIVKSFAWPMGFGLMAIITGSIFAGLGIVTWWPYSAPALSAASFGGSAAGHFLLHHETLSLLWSLLLLWLGYQYFVRKSLKHAFFSPVKQAVLFFTVILLFVAAAWWVSKPSALEPYGKTVIAGRIQSAKPVKDVVLLRAPAFDTVMQMPVRGGTFHGTTTTPLAAGTYYLRAGSFRSEVFFGSNDSLHLDITLKETGNEEKITGTRIAENEYLTKNRGNNWWQLTEFAYNFNAKGYAAQALSEWSNGQKSIDKFKTIDNIRPRPDFLALQRKLLAVDLLHLLDNYYPQVHAVYHPNETLAYPASLMRLRKAVSTDDSSLASYPAYRSYVAALARTKSGRNDSLYLSLLSGIPNEQVRDAVMYEAVQNEVFRSRDSLRRRVLFQQAVASISDTRLAGSLRAKEAKLQSLGRGRQAPNFAAEAINNQTFDLAKLSNRYVVLDVWATWCVPCKKEAPFFDELADKYTSEQVAFVSVSIDENKNAWRMEAAGNKAKVLQLWAKNADEDFGKSFAVSSIPRYMLIDPKGRIVNADLPPPSDPQFEAELQKEISFLRERSF